jgi:hypothetical protein
MDLPSILLMSALLDLSVRDFVLGLALVAALWR